MRFLQIEWHNHERARNAWDIERAEMKAKIAKHEGECRHAKRTNEQLDRQVRMLEAALKAERRKKGSDPDAPLQPPASTSSTRRESPPLQCPEACAWLTSCKQRPTTSTTPSSTPLLTDNHTAKSPKSSWIRVTERSNTCSLHRRTLRHRTCPCQTLPPRTPACLILQSL